MSDGAPANDKLCLTDHHARLAVLERMLDEKIQSVKERMDLKFDAARDAIEIASEASNAALKLQYGITDEHLKNLNGEAERLRVMQASYVPREVFESKHEDIDKAIRSLETFQANQLGRQAMIALVVGLFASGITAVLVRWLAP